MGLREKIVKENKKRNKFKVGQIWEDELIASYYVVTEVTRKEISGIFLDNEWEFTQLINLCQNDDYVRDITDLEWELYVDLPRQVRNVSRQTSQAK